VSEDADAKSFDAHPKFENARLQGAG